MDNFSAPNVCIHEKWPHEWVNISDFSLRSVEAILDISFRQTEGPLFVLGLLDEHLDLTLFVG